MTDRASDNLPDEWWDRFHGLQYEQDEAQRNIAMWEQSLLETNAALEAMEKERIKFFTPCQPSENEV